MGRLYDNGWGIKEEAGGVRTQVSVKFENLFKDVEIFRDKLAAATLKDNAALVAEAEAEREEEDARKRSPNGQSPELEMAKRKTALRHEQRFKTRMDETVALLTLNRAIDVSKLGAQIDSEASTAQIPRQAAPLKVRTAGGEARDLQSYRGMAVVILFSDPNDARLASDLRQLGMIGEPGAIQPFNVFFAGSEAEQQTALSQKRFKYPRGVVPSLEINGYLQQQKVVSGTWLLVDKQGIIQAQGSPLKVVSHLQAVVANER